MLCVAGSLAKRHDVCLLCNKIFLVLIQVVAAMHTLGAGEAADAELRKVERQVAPHTKLLGPEVQ